MIKLIFSKKCKSSLTKPNLTVNLFDSQAVQTTCCDYVDVCEGAVSCCDKSTNKNIASNCELQEEDGINIRLKSGEKVQGNRKTKVLKILSLALGGVVGLINGFFGGGGGMISVPLLQYGLGVDKKVSHASTILIILPLCIASALTYYIKGNVELNGDSYFLILFVTLGGFVGATLLNKISSIIISVIFAIIIISSGVRLLM